MWHQCEQITAKSKTDNAFHSFYLTSPRNSKCAPRKNLCAITGQIVKKDKYRLLERPFVNLRVSNQVSPYNKWQCYSVALCVWGMQCKMGRGMVLEWCMHILQTRVYRERETDFPPKCIRRCKRGCEGPWHRLARLTDWKQGFIFSNLWSQCRERSVRGRRGEGVLGETLVGEMKDIVQDKLSSADVDESRPANGNKWDCFDLNLTCRFRKPSLCFAFTRFSLSLWHLSTVYVIEQAHKSLSVAGNKTDAKWIGP